MSCAAKGVLLDGDLLGCVWGYVLGGSGRQDVAALGQLSLVCRKWREVSLWEAWWARIKDSMLPLLWEEEAGGGEAVGSRGRVMGYGRFLEEQRELVNIPQSDEEWLQGLEALVEVFDRMDGLQMASMRGPVSFQYDDEEDTWMMDISSKSPKFRKGECAAFSAASRDPERRFATIHEYQERGHREEYPCCLCMRVTLRDMRTGRMAVVWEEEKGQVDELEDEDDDYGPGVWWSFGKMGKQQNLVGRLVAQGQANFVVDRVPGFFRTRVSRQDVLYTIKPQGAGVMFMAISDEIVPLTMEQLKWALKAVLASGRGL
jgi:hypothetical protein